MPDIYIALVHYPVLNKEGRVVTTSITNFDIHDLCRTACTYGVKKVFFVTPSEPQQKMVHYISDYWQRGTGSQYNPDRKDALDLAEVSDSLEQTCLTIEALSGKKPDLIVTTAKNSENSISYNFFKEHYAKTTQPILLVFGTGHGLALPLIKNIKWVLQPIKPVIDYNHLPVRSAVAIILDRIFALPYD